MPKRLIKRKNNDNFGLLTKLIIMICLGMVPTFAPLIADEKSNLETIYHIYVDERHIGEVGNKDVVQQMIDDKIETGIQTYEDLEISLKEEITIIPEKSFQPTYDNEKVVKNLEDRLTIAAQAETITIDGEIVGYFNSGEASEVLKKYKLKYIDEKDLDKLEDAEEPKELAVDDVVISDATFSKEVAVQTETISPEEMLSVNEGVKLLEKGSLEENKHKVSEGEVMGSIAKQYDLSTKQLLSLNPELSEDTILRIDQKLNVTTYEPFIDVLITENKKVEEKIDYDVEIIESKDMYKGEEKIKQKGKQGKKEVQYRVEKQNGQVINQKKLSEDIIKNPTDKIIVKGTKVIPSRGTGILTWPANGGYISSHQGNRWGSYHKGIDIAGPSSREISAADHGVVESAGTHGGYGNKIVINHNNGMKTIYAHLSSFEVKAGQIVEKGTKIGIMGSTGDSTGIHLHFEVYQDEKLKDPMEYF